MIDAQNRLQDKENFKVELEPCLKCKRKDRLVNVKLGQAYCNVCRALKMDIGNDAQIRCASLTVEEIRTFTEDELKIYEYRISDKYREDLYYGR
jgi:hypothetical protein